MPRRLALFFGALAGVSGCSAGSRVNQPAPSVVAAPSTDIYLYKLRRLLPFGARVVNITNRPGYDNQPAWDGNDLLYTVAVTGPTDIYRYHDGGFEQVTSTPESEYSAAITPDGTGISVVRVERDSTQRLWKFPNGGGTPSLVLRDIKPVGYYAWLDSTTLALFVLGSPNTLQIADTRTGAAKVVTTNIGRSLQRVPGGRRASYVHREGQRWMLETVDPDPRADGSFDIRTVAPLPDSADYVVWQSPTELYTAAGSRIFRMRLPSTKWVEVADLAGDGVRGITRLALSPDGATLALVAEEPRVVPR